MHLQRFPILSGPHPALNVVRGTAARLLGPHHVQPVLSQLHNPNRGSFLVWPVVLASSLRLQQAKHAHLARLVLFRMGLPLVVLLVPKDTTLQNRVNFLV